ncbi:MAG: hopanoid biosynthesis-associated protein HpnK [Acidobacteriia bacterium]|nr:hopanoid biosynthesis-associated protein HpnK [Methyloceanibacter sp.]MCL6491023.1 hopanoid biosynthesis-associated protein HpnK [Terriglobia bacterium]
MRRVIISADDFGLSAAVNEAVERACREGILSTASLMVAAPFAADAVRRARALPGLRVGLHVVLVDGPAACRIDEIPDLLDENGRFGADQWRRGVSYFFSPRVRAQLQREIAAQFRAFHRFGLALDHVNAHKHMHLHPAVARLVIEIGRDFGLRALRVPAEPPAVLGACGTPPHPAQFALYAWSRVLRRQALRAGLTVNDYAFGIAWSGHMTLPRLLRLAEHLPEGVSEIYFHPASERDGVLKSLMPDYEHEAELAALLDPRFAQALAAVGAHRTSYGELHRG